MNETGTPDNTTRLEAALRRFDDENSRDPNLCLVDGIQIPHELLYSRWLCEWVLRLSPRASEALRLAARGAHLCRWMIARDSYPDTRAGYLRWRQDLKGFHARRVGEILRELSYEEDLIARVQALISKANFPSDSESQVLEDALCLVFLERQFANLAQKSTDEKMINALRKTWKKMSPAAHTLALTLNYGPHEKSLLDQALAA